MRPRIKKVLLIVVIAVVAVVGVPIVLGYVWWQHHYPYGWSHCCDLNLYFALRDCATRHGGVFPKGEATPEASLSLLYREKRDDGWRLADERLLRGKTVPESVVKEILQRGELLTPETCGWHYVEGLRLDDDPRLALFWDKAGLDHNGGLLADGDHIVMFVDGQRKYFPEAEWDAFAKEQQKLLAVRGTPAEIVHRATIHIDGKEVHLQVRVLDDGIYGSTWSGSEMIATVKKQELGVQGLPVIPRDEIKNAKVIVEPERGRVRFGLHDGNIIFDRSGFHCEATATASRQE
jgi:hypothetical protein